MNINARFGFEYIDTESTEALKDELRNKAHRVYSIDNKIYSTGESTLRTFFARLYSYKAGDHIPLMESTLKLKEDPFGKFLDDETINLLMKKFVGNKDLEEKIIQVFHETMTKGVVREDIEESFFIKNPENRKIKPVTRNNFYYKRNINNKIIEKLKKVLGHGWKEDQIGSLSQVIQRVIKENVFYDEYATKTYNDELVNKVEPVVIFIQEGERILLKGEKVKLKHLRILEAQRQELLRRKSGLEHAFSITGLILLITLFFILEIEYLRRFLPEIFSSNSRLLLLEILVLITLALMAISLRVGIYFPMVTYLMPISIASIMIAIMLDIKLACFTTLLIGVLGGLMKGQSFYYQLIGISGGLVGAYTAVGIRKRSQLIKAGFAVGLTYFISIFAVSMLSGGMPFYIMQKCIWGFSGGLLSAFVVIALLPAVEMLFQITTDIGLLELSDMNHPLLKQLMLNAPGTYHHSLIVGHLAESAAEAVGANPLLARVQGYFHDIGKLNKPEYFTENEWNMGSRHDTLNPSMSSLIIISHVKDGVDLAAKYRLNRQIVNAIQQHHGMSMVYFFYRRAVERAKKENSNGIQQDDFRYSGPKPHTKEIGILMMADAVEAASRSLSNPTPARIENMISEIVQGRLLDAQLNECDLTLREIDIIKKRFVYILTTQFHSRISYPEPLNEKEKKNGKNENTNSKPSENTGN
ncbi:MAG: HDIG domain-containing protein [Candidatus Theseobacter exili]|nr:HDIG domain-containing protein [Candidatus Theseobacter exili]